MQRLKPIIAIDGPAGSGKSTVAKLIAKRLGLFYIDTGAMYRVLALKAREEKIQAGNVQAIIRLLKRLDFKMEYFARSGRLKVVLDGRDVSEEIRKPYVTEQVSAIAKIKQVREYMVGLQRMLAAGRKAILEGRDTATVVFPDAYKKFYLDAHPEQRFRRRLLELKAKIAGVDEKLVRRDITRRDKTDSTRRHSPLKRAADAFYIDTTRLSIEQVVRRMLKLIRQK